MAHPGFGEVAERLRRSTVHVVDSRRSHRGSGSGVVWRAGLIVTNAHVARADEVAVELWDGRRLDAAVTARDPRRDVAALQVSGLDAADAEPGDSSSLRAGELVLAVGNPLGFLGALTTGVVHGVGPVPGMGKRRWVQASIRLAPGNSGGPLADARGRVVGINTMVVSGGLGLAVPSEAIESFLNRGSTPSLGVVVRPVPVDRNGAVALLILDVAPDGPAAAASLRAGDLLTAANGRTFLSVDDLSDTLDASPALLTLEFRRGDRRLAREVHVRLSTSAAAGGAAASFVSK